MPKVDGWVGLDTMSVCFVADCYRFHVLHVLCMFSLLLLCRVVRMFDIDFVRLCSDPFGLSSSNCRKMLQISLEPLRRRSLKRLRVPGISKREHEEYIELQVSTECPGAGWWCCWGPHREILFVCLILFRKFQIGFLRVGDCWFPNRSIGLSTQVPIWKMAAYLNDFAECVSG